MFSVVYQLEPTGSGTRLSQIDDIDWKISKLVLPIARMMVSRDMARQLASLKRTLEGALSIKLPRLDFH